MRILLKKIWVRNSWILKFYWVKCYWQKYESRFWWFNNSLQKSPKNCGKFEKYIKCLEHTIMWKYFWISLENKCQWSRWYHSCQNAQARSPNAAAIALLLLAIKIPFCVSHSWRKGRYLHTLTGRSIFTSTFTCRLCKTQWSAQFCTQDTSNVKALS